MKERKCFTCREFKHMTYNCRNMEEKRLAQMLSNKFEVLRSRVMQKEEGREVEKDKKEILREERAKKEVEVRQTKVEKEGEKRKIFERSNSEDQVKAERRRRRDSIATGLVISEEFVRKHRFRKMKLERLVYMRNMDGTLNYAGPIVDTVEVEIYFKGHKERMSIDVIEGQKWKVILGIPWLACHNPETDWRIGEVQMMRCLEEYRKKWRTRKQTKLEWKKQEAKEKKEKKEKREDFRRLTIDEEMTIARIVEEKEEEENLIELRAVEEMVPRWFYKYLKVFEKKKVREDANKEGLESCHKSQRRICSKKGEDISIIKGRERGSTGVCERLVKKRIH